MTESPYYGIAGDITRNCNLRCPFCLSDFSQYKQKGLMAEETFEKFLSLLPLVREGGTVLMSCLYEPSIHPQWLDLYERVPAEQRKKCVFTTNLVRVTEAEMDRIARLGFQYVNISVDSFTPEVFEGLRKGAKFDVFIAHLRYLANRLAEQEHPMKLRTITVVSNKNAAEVPAIVERCVAEFGSTQHEVRAIYQIDHMDEGWKRANLPPNDVWLALERFAAETKHNVALETPPARYFPEDGEAYSRTGPPPPPPGEGKRSFPLSLRVRSDGLVNLYGKDMCFDLHKLADPQRFFREAAPVFLAECDIVAAL
jgi:MoaA/NifB/PqqE/SkfB family radical SAM enzyme